jgi:hypothetical protein
MRRSLAAAAAAAGAGLCLAACGGGDATGEAQSATTAEDLPQGSEPVDLDPAAFTVEIDNRY